MSSGVFAPIPEPEGLEVEPVSPVEPVEPVSPVDPVSPVEPVSPVPGTVKSPVCEPLFKSPLGVFAPIPEVAPVALVEPTLVSEELVPAAAATTVTS